MRERKQPLAPTTPCQSTLHSSFIIPRAPMHANRMEMPFMRRRKSRRRNSLQDDKSSRFKRQTSRPSLERHSTRHLTSTMEEALLEHVRVDFIKAIVPGQKLGKPRYIMRITNQALGRSWEMGRSFSEFHELKEKIVRVLNHGHFCTADCPWIYMFVTHHFPHRQLFQWRRARVIATRLTELQKFINTLLSMIRDNRTSACPDSADNLPRLLYEFLFEGMMFSREDFNNTLLEDRVSIHSGKPSDVGELPQEFTCHICSQALMHTSTSLSSIESTCATETSGSTEHELQALSTLECGHRFHDECILTKLNETLMCPICGA